MYASLSLYIMLPLYAILDTYREKKTPKVLRFIYVLVLMQAASKGDVKAVSLCP